MTLKIEQRGGGAPTSEGLEGSCEKSQPCRVDLPEGQILVVGDLVGEGGTASVWKGWVEDQGVMYPKAVKVLIPDEGLYSLGLDVQDQFRLAVSVAHPKVVSPDCVIKRVKTPIGVCDIMLMELLDKECVSLDQSLRDSESIDIWSMLSQVAEVVDDLREQGVWGLDLKPESIFWNEESCSVKITDLTPNTVLQTIAREKGLDICLGCVGTPEFMSPEHLVQDRLTDSSDLFVFGEIIFNVRTGRPLFGKHVGVATISYFLSCAETWGVFLETQFKIAELCDAERDYFGRALAYQPENRFQTGAEMVGALRVLDVGV